MSKVLRFASTDTPSKNPLLSLIEEQTEQDAFSCYQCGKCSAGCPIIHFMDLGPQRVLRGIQMGQKDALLQSTTIWLCAACQTCNTRCPRKIDIPRIMDALRGLARRENVKIGQPTMTAFHDVLLKDVELTGRLYEAGLFGGYVLKSMQIADGIGLAFRQGLTMLAKGKIGILPEFANGRGEVAEIIKRASRMK